MFLIFAATIRRTDLVLPNKHMESKYYFFEKVKLNISNHLNGIKETINVKPVLEVRCVKCANQLYYTLI